MNAAAPSTATSRLLRLVVATSRAVIATTRDACLFRDCGQPGAGEIGRAAGRRRCALCPIDHVNEVHAALDALTPVRVVSKRKR